MNGSVGSRPCLVPNTSPPSGLRGVGGEADAHVPAELGGELTVSSSSCLHELASCWKEGAAAASDGEVERAFAERGSWALRRAGRR